MTALWLVIWRPSVWQMLHEGNPGVGGTGCAIGVALPGVGGTVGVGVGVGVAGAGVRETPQPHSVAN